jgi:hypothetical protein
MEADREAKRRMYQAYVDRWKSVKATEDAEIRQLSPAERFAQFVQFVELSKRMGLRTSTPEEDREAAERWRKYREAQLG